MQLYTSPKGEGTLMRLPLLPHERCKAEQRCEAGRSRQDTHLRGWARNGSADTDFCEAEKWSHAPAMRR